MKKRYRKMWQIDVGLKLPSKDDNINRFNHLLNKSIDIMQTKAESKLNPLKHSLSDEAKKRLKWMYIIHFECNKNIAKASRRIGVSRQWLSKIHSVWIKDKDPSSLEPESKAPENTDNRNRIDETTEDKITKARKKYHWGKDKLMVILDREYDIQVGASTINRYLDKHGLLDIKISNRIKTAHRNRIEQKQKCRPPKEIKDYKPGALVEKDMKFIMKIGSFVNLIGLKVKTNDSYWCQHTVLDSFTRIRTIGLARDSESKTAVAVQEKCEKRFPFPIACANTDNGSENEKYFDSYLERNKIVHFYSRSGTPTDNPRVERSHLTDEVEFYQHGNIYKTFEEQEKRIAKHEYRYNYIRPHQALDNLTPIAFYELWKINPNKAYKIVEKWQKYLKKQSKRLASSRKMKNRKKIAKLMDQIDKKLDRSYK